jgi:TonB family protein
MLCFLKRVLPFTLTLIVGTGLGSVFNLFNSSPQPTAPEARSYRLEAGYGYGGGGGCRNRRRTITSIIKSAEIVYQPEPFYTEAARRNHTEGEVRLRLTLGADGTVSNIETITALPDGLTEQARRAASQIRFNPSTRDGVPIDEVKDLTYNFDLN